MKTVRLDHRTFTVRDFDYERIKRARRGYEADLSFHARYDYEHKREVVEGWAFGRVVFEIKPLKKGA